MTSEFTDPWASIRPPDQMTSVSAKRADPAMRWGVFWALNVEGDCLLLLQHARNRPPVRRMPKFRGLRVEARSPEDGDHDLLIIRLADAQQREIFHRLCLDIIVATSLAQTEDEAIERFLARTWRWHKLLAGGGDSRLSEEEQKGLIGELHFLDRHLLSMFGAQEVMRFWTGPLGAPKDFEVGRICVESKARRGAATPYVLVSSEHQLETAGADALFLHVLEVSGGDETQASTVTVATMAADVRARIAASDMSSVELFEERLMAAGFEWSHDYSDKHWIVGPEHVYEVREGFPRVTPTMFPPGVVNVRYSISLPECEPFRSDIEEFKKMIMGA